MVVLVMKERIRRQIGEGCLALGVHWSRPQSDEESTNTRARWSRTHLLSSFSLDLRLSGRGPTSSFSLFSPPSHQLLFLILFFLLCPSFLSFSFSLRALRYSPTSPLRQKQPHTQALKQKKKKKTSRGPTTNNHLLSLSYVRLRFSLLFFLFFFSFVLSPFCFDLFRRVLFRFPCRLQFHNQRPFSSVLLLLRFPIASVLRDFPTKQTEPFVTPPSQPSDTKIDPTEATKRQGKEKGKKKQKNTNNGPTESHFCTNDTPPPSPIRHTRHTTSTGHIDRPSSWASDTQAPTLEQSSRHRPKSGDGLVLLSKRPFFGRRCDHATKTKPQSS